jgi:hypothetical protein
VEREEARELAVPEAGMIQLRHYDPAIPLLASLKPYIDIRRGSPHPLAWRGGDYLDELRATYRRDRGIFALVRESGVVVMGCSQTLPVLAGVFRALGWEVDDNTTFLEQA